MNRQDHLNSQPRLIGPTRTSMDISVKVHKSDAMGNVFTLLSPIRLDDYGITVPAGFQSDGASVPRFFWRIVFPPGDTRALLAALVHDWIYRTHPRGWTREMADVLFLTLLMDNGIPWYSADLAYIGIRLFGWLAWKQKQ